VHSRERPPALRIEHGAPQMAEVPQIAEVPDRTLAPITPEVPHIAFVPHMAFVPQMTVVPHIALLPHRTVALPRALFESTSVSDPWPSGAAAGETAAAVATSVEANAAGTSR